MNLFNFANHNIPPST